MLKDRIVFLNGDYIPWDQATVHIMCHSFGRGSAIFEVLSLHETGEGPAVFRLDEHITRLFRSAELLSMELPISGEELSEAVIDTVKRNAINQGAIKIICFYPQIDFEILPSRTRLDISIFVIDTEKDLGGLSFSFEEGTTVCIPKCRKLDPQTVPVEAKAAANYLNGIMARQEAKKRGFNDAIMLDTQGYIAEGGTEAAFLIKEDKLMTASPGTVLKSISRKSILQMANIIGIETFEGRLLPELLLQADEIFLSCTPSKLLPVRQIEDRKLAETPGPMTSRLYSLMKKIVTGQDERFKDWLFLVK